LTELGFAQLIWELSLAGFLGWLALIWRRPIPVSSWSLEAAALLVAQMLVVTLYSLLEASVGSHGYVFGVALLMWAGGWWSAYWVLRLTQCRGDRLLLPLACLLSGIGWVLQVRLSHALAFRQAIWLLLGLGVLIVVATYLRNLSHLDRWRWPLVATCVALQGGLLIWGEERNGAALWYTFGSVSFQPIEIVKVIVVCLLASFLCRALPQLNPSQRLSRRTLAGTAMGFAALELLLVAQRDLGMALLFFGLFLLLFYLVSGRTAWVLGLLALSSLGAMAGYLRFGHVRVRVEAWLDPLSNYQESGYQISEAMFALAWGGWLGTGIGRGEPWRVPEAATDFVYVAWCEEMGVLGGCLLWAAIAMFLVRCFRASQRASLPFERILAVGLACLMAWQTCIVLFGVLKVMPMTGITLPFLSYGGSSLLSNFVILALLQRMTQDEP